MQNFLKSFVAGCFQMGVAGLACPSHPTRSCVCSCFSLQHGLYLRYFAFLHHVQWFWFTLFPQGDLWILCPAEWLPRAPERWPCSSLRNYKRFTTGGMMRIEYLRYGVCPPELCHFCEMGGLTGTWCQQEMRSVEILCVKYFLYIYYHVGRHREIFKPLRIVFRF